MKKIADTVTLRIGRRWESLGQKQRQWLWFIGLWCAGLACVLTLGAVIRAIMGIE